MPLLAFFWVEIKPQVDMDRAEWRIPTNSRPHAESQWEESCLPSDNRFRIEGIGIVH